MGYGSIWEILLVQRSFVSQLQNLFIFLSHYQILIDVGLSTYFQSVLLIDADQSNRQTPHPLLKLFV